MVCNSIHTVFCHPFDHIVGYFDGQTGRWPDDVASSRDIWILHSVGHSAGKEGV